MKVLKLSCQVSECKPLDAGDRDDVTWRDVSPAAARRATTTSRAGGAVVNQLLLLGRSNASGAGPYTRPLFGST